MKRKIVSTALFLALLIITSLLLSACFPTLLISSYHSDYADDTSCYYKYNRLRRDAFCTWVSTISGETNFVIADEIRGVPITALGSENNSTDYFHVLIPTNTPEGTHYRTWTADTYPQVDEHHAVDDADCQTLLISIHLGANILLIFAGGRWYVGHSTQDGYGGNYHVTMTVLVKIVFRFTVSESNLTFFAEDGKLYYKESGELFEGFFYE